MPLCTTPLLLQLNGWMYYSQPGHYPWPPPCKHDTRLSMSYASASLSDHFLFNYECVYLLCYSWHSQLTAESRGSYVGWQFAVLLPPASSMLFLLCPPPTLPSSSTVKSLEPRLGGVPTLEARVACEESESIRHIGFASEGTAALDMLCPVCGI